MKKTHLILIAVLAFAATSCKKDNWLDWKTENQLWLEQNKITYADDPSFHISPSGLQYRILSDPNPSDAMPHNNSIITCDYTGKLINGAQFDGGTGSFTLSSTISGFIEGLKKIHTHGDIELYIPYELGYGTEGSGTEGTYSYIPPYSTLIFTIHLSAIQ